MSKELIICGIIIIAIIGLDILIGNFVDDKMNQTIELLNDLRKDVEEQNYDVAREKVDEIVDYWYESEKFFSFYIEHDELEKVATELTSLNAHIELENDDSLEGKLM